MANVSFMRYWKTIRNYEYVSFDIFDTLIKRNVPHPADVFTLIGDQDPSLPSFKEERIAAEKTARLHRHTEEVSLEDIYSYLPYPPDTKRKAIQAELRTEEAICVPDYPMIKLYKKCIKNGKKVLITSDMYLPEDTVRKILHRCGISDFYKLYLSSTAGLQKISGNLYRYILKDLDISAESLIHIGDSKRADFLAALKLGIHPILISRNINNTAFLHGEILKEEPFVYINNILPKYKSAPDMYQWGYEAYGPLVLGFCAWIHKQYQASNIEQMYFLARDMHIMLDVYRKLYPDDAVRYLEVSRRSLRAAYILKQNRIDAIFDTMARIEYSVEQLCDSIGLDSAEIVSSCSSDIKSSDPFPKSGTEEYNELNRIILKKLRESDDKAVDYLHYMGFFEDEKTAIADIGWHGTTQNMLEIISGKRLTGFYLGSTVRSYFRKMDVHGYWFNTEDEYSMLPKLTLTSILEVMLFPRIGTTVSYKTCGGTIMPVYGPCEMDETFHLIQEFQDGALQFVCDFTEKSGLHDYNFPSSIALAAYSKLAFQPTLYQSKLLGSIPYEEGTIKRLANPRHIYKYLADPRMLAEDYKNSRWKTGFIKQLFPLMSRPDIIDALIKNRNKK